MATYVLLTKISPESMAALDRLKTLEEEVKQRISTSCPKVRWISNYMVLGPYDYLDIFEAPDEVTAGKVATIVRSFGHATTETWGAIPWEQFKVMIRQL